MISYIFKVNLSLSRLKSYSISGHIISIGLSKSQKLVPKIQHLIVKRRSYRPCRSSCQRTNSHTRYIFTNNNDGKEVRQYFHKELDGPPKEQKRLSIWRCRKTTKVKKKDRKKKIESRRRKGSQPDKQSEILLKSEHSSR